MLQATTVFSNVSKGVLAKDKELQAAFGTTDQRAICLEILAKGELQVGRRRCLCQFAPSQRAAATASLLVGRIRRSPRRSAS